MAVRSTQNIGFGNFMHGNGRLYAGFKAHFLHGILQRQAVDDRGQHSHMICGSPVHTIGTCGNASENIAAPHNNAGLHTQFDDGFDLPGYILQHIRVDAEFLIPHERLTA